jgi:glycosyltransferase involved in cell wall biosynthesis
VRVALVYEYFTSRDSLGRDRLLLGRALAGRGIDVDCYCTRGATTEIPGVTYHEVDPVRGLGRAVEYASFAARATKALRRDRGRYDIVDVAGTTAWEHDVVRVHAVQRGVQDRWPQEGGRGFRAARLRSRFAHVTGPRIGVARAVQRLQMRPGRYAHALAVADEVKDDLEAYYDVPPDRIDVVHCPVDIDRLTSASPAPIREQLGLGDAPVALFVGHDFERKGLDEAIETIAAVGALHLAVVGDGNRPPYEALARRRGVGDRVHFLGGVDAPEPYFAAADLFLLSTREDIWGIAVIEAMAAGLPVVLTAAAGTAQLVRDSGAGLVASNGSLRDLRDAVGRLARDEVFRRELGDRGRVAAVPFGVGPFADAVIGAYEKVLAERR